MTQSDSKSATGKVFTYAGLGAIAALVSAGAAVLSIPGCAPMVSQFFSRLHGRETNSTSSAPASGEKGAVVPSPTPTPAPASSGPSTTEQADSRVAALPAPPTEQAVQASAAGSSFGEGSVVPTQQTASSARVQFYPTAATAEGGTAIEIAPCLQTDRTLICTIYVTAGSRGGRWMMDRKSTIQDENGSSIEPSSITVGGVVHDPRTFGKLTPISAETKTRVQYKYENIGDASKLQTLNITVCCIRNLAFHRQ